MRKLYPEDYAALEKEVFNQTLPFGAQQQNHE
jgi:hypothetical protein